MLPLVAMLLCAVPEPVKVAMPALRLTDIPAERGGFYTEQVAVTMIGRGVRVLTDRDMAALLGLERQRQLLGCGADSSACLVELADALGVDGLLLGDVAKIGNRYQANLRVINARTGATVAISSFKAANDEELVDGLVKASDSVTLELLRSFGRPVAVAREGASISRSTWWIPALGTAAALGAGAACLALSRDDYARLDPVGARGSLSVQEASNAASRGKNLQTASVVLFAVAAAAALGTVSVIAFGSKAQLSAAVTPSGAAVSVAMVFP